MIIGLSYVACETPLRLEFKRRNYRGSCRFSEGSRVGEENVPKFSGGFFDRQQFAAATVSATVSWERWPAANCQIHVQYLQSGIGLSADKTYAQTTHYAHADKPDESERLADTWTETTVTFDHLDLQTAG